MGEINAKILGLKGSRRLPLNDIFSYGLENGNKAIKIQ
jgi:hypothetical protein